MHTGLSGYIVSNSSQNVYDVKMSEALDRAVVESRHSRVASTGTRLGSILLAGLCGYGVSRHGIELEAASWTGLAISTVGGGTVGIRLGLERVAAKTRLKKPSYEQSRLVAAPSRQSGRGLASIPQIGAEVFLAASAYTYSADQIHMTTSMYESPLRSALFAAGACLLSEVTLRMRGPDVQQMEPIRHEQLHLIPIEQSPIQ